MANNNKNTTWPAMVLNGGKNDNQVRIILFRGWHTNVSQLFLMGKNCLTMGHA